MITFELVSQDYFVIKFTNFFDAQVKEGIKAYQSKGNGAVMWDQEKKCWNVKIEYYREIYTNLEEYCLSDGTVTLQGIPNFAFDLISIDVPFSKNFSFDEHLSKFNYKKDLEKNYSIENVPKSIRDNLYGF